MLIKVSADSLDMFEDGRHKTIPHQFTIINNKRVIYLREKLTDHFTR